MSWSTQGNLNNGKTLFRAFFDKLPPNFLFLPLPKILSAKLNIPKNLSFKTFMVRNYIYRNEYRAFIRLRSGFFDVYLSRA